MAKKTVASLQSGKTDGRSYTKVIKVVKSPKTGAYCFDEQMVRNEDVAAFFKDNFENRDYSVPKPPLLGAHKAPSQKAIASQSDGFFVVFYIDECTHPTFLS